MSKMSLKMVWDKDLFTLFTPYLLTCTCHAPQEKLGSSQSTLKLSLNGSSNSIYQITNEHHVNMQIP